MDHLAQSNLNCFGKSVLNRMSEVRKVGALMVRNAFWHAHLDGNPTDTQPSPDLWNRARVANRPWFERCTRKPVSGLNRLPTIHHDHGLFPAR